MSVESAAWTPRQIADEARSGAAGHAVGQKSSDPLKPGASASSSGAFDAAAGAPERRKEDDGLAWAAMRAAFF